MESRVDFDSDQKLEDHETFYAGYVAGNEYDLNFEKEVTGFEDTRKEFDFTAVFSYEGQPFNPSDSLIRFANLHRQADGVYTFTAAPTSRSGLLNCRKMSLFRSMKMIMQRKDIRQVLLKMVK